MSEQPTVFLLEQCMGTEPEKCNDVLFTGLAQEPSVNVVFFGGDVQDLKLEMLKKPECTAYARWNLESTAGLLRNRFSSENGWSNPHVWVIRPSQWKSLIFAAYNNFLPFDGRTVPQIGHGVRQIGALEQLSAVLHTALARLREIHPSYSAHFRAPLCLIGFSKGCSVLIQILYELAYCRGFCRDSFIETSSNPTPSTQELLSRLSSLYWLDGGHSGLDNQWPTRSCILSRLDPMKSPKLYFYGTPYQLMDPQRPWKSRDYKLCLELLQQYDLPHKHGIFSDETTGIAVHSPTLTSHFELLSRFPIENST